MTKLEKSLLLALVEMIEQHCDNYGKDGKTYFAGFLSTNSCAFNALIQAGYAKSCRGHGEVNRSDGIVLDVDKLEFYRKEAIS